MTPPEMIRATDLQPLRNFEAGPFTVHTEWNKIINTERLMGAGSGSIELMRVMFSDPNLELASKVSRNATSSLYTDGTITYGSGIVAPRVDDYFDAFNTVLKQQDMKMGRSLFDGTRLVKTSERVVGAVALRPDMIEASNHGRFSINGAPGVVMQMEPPSLADLAVGNMQYEYIKSTLQMQLLAAIALAECVTGRKVSTSANLLITGQGGTYQYDEDAATGRRLRERIVLAGAPQMLENSKSVELSEPEPSESKVMISDIIGSPKVHDQLRQVVRAFKYPEAMAKWGVRMSQGVLLHGEPGTGKTMTAQALANEIGGELWEIQVNGIRDKWIGNSERNMQALFDEAAQKTTPTVMLWDEIDSIIGSSGDGSGSATQTMEAVRGIFKREAARLSERAPKVILVGTTNDISRIDDAMLRAGRFDTKIYMEKPNEMGRMQLIASKIAAVVSELGNDGHTIYSPDINIKRLAEETESWSGAELSEILTRAQRKKAFEEAEGKRPGPITQQELEHEINLYRQER